MTKREQIKQKYNGCCSYCGQPLDDKWQVDHKISKQYWFYWNRTEPGAVNNMDNLIPACKEDNHYKREKCVESQGYHIGYREYLSTFHIRLRKLPKNTQVERTKRRIQYMWTIANKYGITPDKPFSGVFYMDNWNNHERDNTNKEV